MIKIEDIIAGESYACRFKHNEYEGIGLLLTRDLEQKIVKLRDTESLLEFIVPFDNIWDVDYVKWSDEAES